MVKTSSALSSRNEIIQAKNAIVDVDVSNLQSRFEELKELRQIQYIS